MKERPILFNGEMARAILEGRKTQTRRIVPERILEKYYEYDEWCNAVSFDGATRDYEKKFFLDRVPYGLAGDRLWVRETFSLSPSGNPIYRANYCGDTSTAQTIDIKTGETGSLVWKPSIFMPRWASRITLEITGVRVERLNEISEADAIAEGIESFAGFWRDYSQSEPAFPGSFSPVDSYRSLWESINGPDSWAANPFVWVIEFKRVTQ